VFVVPSVSEDCISIIIVVKPSEMTGVIDFEDEGTAILENIRSHSLKNTKTTQNSSSWFCVSK
jgi:hypothetical protein